MQARQTNGHRIDDVHLFVCLSVCLSPKCKKTRFSQKLSNLELWCLLTTCRKLCKLNWAFQRTHYWIPTIQDGWDTPSWKSTWRLNFLLRMVRFGSNFADWYRMTCRLRWCVEMETRCRIPIWRTFGRIQWHVIPEPRITLQGSAATWWIHCHDSRATCHIAGCSHLAKSMSSSCHSAGCKNSIRHIENRFSPYFLLMQCRLWRAAAFVSSPIHLFRAQYSEYWTESEFM